jgi:tetratricopeptide (TPR) repeat protein
MRENVMDKKTRWVLIFLAGFILTGLVRSAHPGADAPFDLSWSQGPSTDAAYYLEPAISLVETGKIETISRNWNAPGYYLLYVPSIALFGTSNDVVNLTTVFIGLLGFVFFFFIVRRTDDEPTVIFAILFWALSYFWIMYTRIPLVYTAMITYMLIAAYLWMLGLKKPIWFIPAWIVLIIAILWVRVIAVALVPALVVGHAAALYGRFRERKRMLSVVFTTMIVLVVVGTLAVIASVYLDFSPVVTALGRIKVHMREGMSGDRVLFYLFNLGQSGAIFLWLPVVSLMSYFYLLIFMGDVLKKRLDFTDTDAVLRLVMVVWLVFGALSTILFEYAPPRYFLFLMPPMFYTAGCALSRLLKPASRVEHDYGYYILLIAWIMFLVFKLLYTTLFYFIRNYDTLVAGLNMSEAGIARFEGMISFFSSFYLLASLSLIVGIVVSLVTFAYHRSEKYIESRPIRKSVRLAVVGVLLVLCVSYQGSMYASWLMWPRHTLSSFSRELGDLLGEDAVLAGPYAHVMTLENDLDAVYMTFIKPDGSSPCDRLEAAGATHLIIDIKNGLPYLEESYPEALECLEYVDTMHIRGNGVDLYRYTGAEEYALSDFERALDLIRQGNAEGAIELLEGVTARHPEDATPLVYLALANLRTGEVETSRMILHQALELNPDHMMVYYGLASIMEIRGDRAAALAYYRKCLELYPESLDLQEKIQELGGVTDG